MRPAVARGAAQVIKSGSQAVTRGGARCLSQVLDRGAQVVARGAAALSQQEKSNPEDLQRSTVHFALVQRQII